MKRAINTGLLHFVFFLGIFALIVGCNSFQRQAEVEEPVGNGKPVVAVLPFIGTDENTEEGENYALIIAQMAEVNNSYQVIPLVSNVLKDLGEEQQLLPSPAASIPVDFVLTGFISHLEAQSLVQQILVDVRTGQLIAGDYRAFEDRNEIVKLLPEMTRTIMTQTLSNNDIPRLAVRTLTISVPSEVTEDSAKILTQLLAISVANTGKYTVYSRTDNISDALNALYSHYPTLAPASPPMVPADFLLTGRIASTPTRRFIAEIVTITNGTLHTGAEMEYQEITDGVALMPMLARLLTDPQSAQQYSQSTAPQAAPAAPVSPSVVPPQPVPRTTYSRN